MCDYAEESAGIAVCRGAERVEKRDKRGLYGEIMPILRVILRARALLSLASAGILHAAKVWCVHLAENAIAPIKGSARGYRGARG